MKALLLTNEYPPNIYGGAGVHVEHLARELSRICQVDLRCFGKQEEMSDNLTVQGFSSALFKDEAPKPLRKVFDALERCLRFNLAGVHANVVHAHTWYTHFGAMVAKLCYGVPLAVTVHSLEPFRPWKREQLAGGYDYSSWIEKTTLEAADAIIAVSQETKSDVLRMFSVSQDRVHVIHNGIDAEEYFPVKAPDLVRAYGINPEKPYILFVGRVTNQKGIMHFMNMLPYLPDDCQAVLYAGSADTPQIENQLRARIAEMQKDRGGVFWINRPISLEYKRALYSHATVFCCPSIYEPFGIINLEAMACETPVVASAVGGIKEVVVHNETGFLVPLDQEEVSLFELPDDLRFAKDLADQIQFLMDSPSLRKKMGKAGRQRALNHFSWSSIAKKTADLYESLTAVPQDKPTYQIDKLYADPA